MGITNLVRSLGEVLTLQRGFDLPAKTRSDGNVPVVSSGGISGWHNEVAVSGPGVVMGRYGTIGQVFFLKEDYWPLNTTLWVSDFKGNDPLFVAILLESIDYKTFSAKTGVPGVNRNELHEVRVFCPPLPEQRAIAAIIATWDRAIEQTTQLIEAKQRLKQGLMKTALIGERRFACFKQQWRRVRIGDVGEVVSGATPNTNEVRYWDGGIPWVTPSEITRLQTPFVSSTERSLTEEGLNACAATLLPAQSLIVCTRATVGDCAVNTIPMAMNQGFKAIIPTRDYSVLFLYYALCTAKQSLMRVAAGSTFAEVPKSAFCAIELPVPGREEQDCIAGMFATIDREIYLIVQQSEMLKAQKQALMQILLTGQVRVKADV